MVQRMRRPGTKYIKNGWSGIRAFCSRIQLVARRVRSSLR
jgi:hypothetical protein